MAYVPGYSHDVFVSYAHDDNEMVRFPNGQGWVDTLVDKLHRLLKPRLGSRDLEFFLDRELMRPNVPITSQLLDAARSSATLVVVMSPSYLVSPWCDRERRAFLDVVKDRVASGSIFLVRAVPVDHDKEPEELRDLTGIKLYTPVEGPEKYRTLGYPDSNELPFISSITRLAGELAEQLKRARGGAADGPSTPGSSGELAMPRTGKHVFVALATDDLEDREVELRSHLQQAGLEVLPSPQSRYPMTDMEAKPLAPAEVRARATSNGGAAEIFISYAREDEQRIRHLCRALEAQGWSVFWDRRIPAGLTWDDYIGRALTGSRCVVVAWSEASVSSRFVKEEAHAAMNRGVLVPVLLDPVAPPFGFSMIQAADLSAWARGGDPAALEQLVADLRRLLPSQAAVAPPLAPGA